jgi:aryl-alcohol dehydrogenase-like predicted oxidoreductase
MPANRVILGTAKLGLEGRESAFEMLDAYVAMGGTHIDTAAVYSDWVPGETGRAETILGEWLKARGNRDRLHITTKGAHPPLSDMHSSRSDAAAIRHDVEQSLRRVGVDVLDRWYFHRDDPSRPVAEVVGPIQDLIAEGKVREYGGSNWSTARVAEALALPGPRFAANQPLGNILCRLKLPSSDDTLATLDAPMFHQAVANNLTLDLFTSQCSGFFERRKSGKPAPVSYANEGCAAAANKIEAICVREHLNVSHVILAFLTNLAPNVRALIGPRNADQLRDNYTAGELVLSPAVMRELAEAADMSDFLKA